MKLNGNSGVPEGWVGLRGVIPRAPIDLTNENEILNVLRPRADVDIVLEGGIRIDRQTWLNGFPPSIRLRGDTSTIGAVSIDGRHALLNSQNSYIATDWDLIGLHNVSCAIGSRTYSIRDGAEDWPLWNAYRWSMGEVAADGVDARPAICGVLIRPPL